MNRLIEAYLSAAGVRYFRGGHDDEYFFLVSDAHGGRFNIHLEVCGAGRDGVALSISPDRYYRAEVRDRLTGLVATWNAGAPDALAVVEDSSDPHLMGVRAYKSYRPSDAAALGESVERTVASAAELFALIRDAAAPAGPLRDAG